MTEEKIDINKIEPLDDEPVSKDQFKGQSHENVADALVKLISKTDGGYAIGLEGSWGSGKSTVINIAEHKLNKEESTDTIVFFSFDAWARQGDPIRRSFLELLIKFLSEKNIIRKKGWEKTLKKIQSKTQEETKYTKPNFTRFGKIMAFYGLLFPFLVIFTRVISSDYSYWITGLYILSVSFLVPFLLIGIEKIVRWYYKEEQSDSLIPSMRLSHHEVKTEQFIKEKDTTTIEFNKYFDHLVEQVSKKKKKLVVVIDNLDRLTPNAIKSIWGTMRNFFTTEHRGERYGLLKSAYLIVPYDLNYISTIFSNKNNVVGQVENNSPSRNNRSESGFIDKTFKLSFQVSPPILSHWKSFFFEQLDAAFQDQLNASLKHDLYKLFEFKFQARDQAITPRSIKKFINSLVVQVIEWKNEIPVKYLALYVLHKDDITLNYRKFVESSILDQRTRNYLAGDNWIKYLAAAYHKVDPESALQISLGEPIKRALVNGNVSKLQDFKKSDWFATILSFVFEDNCKEWALNEPDTYSTVAETLSKIDLKSKHTEKNIWDNLAKHTNYFKSIKKPSKEFANGLNSIIENSAQKLLCEMGKNIFESLINVTDEEEDSKVVASKYFDYVSILFSALEKRIGTETSLDLLKHVRLPNDSKFLIYFAAKIHAFKGFSLSNFRENNITEKVEKEIKTSISDDLVFEKLPQSIREFIESSIKLDYESIAQAIQNRIRQNKPTIAGRELGNLIYILLFLEYENKDANSILTKLVSDGVLLALFNRTEDDSMTKAVILLKIIKQYEDLNSISAKSNVPTYSNNSSGLKSLKKICKDPAEDNDIVNFMVKIGCELGYFQSILNAVTVNTDYKLLNTVVDRMVENECINGIIIEVIIKNPNFVEFMKSNNSVQKFFDLIDQVKFDVDTINSLSKISVAALESSIATNSQIGNQIVDKIKKDLEGKDQEEWDQILEQESHEIDLMLTLIKKGNTSFLSEHFSQSLLSYAVKFLEGESNLSQKNDEWQLLPKALGPNTRDTFYERLYDKLVNYNEIQVFELITLLNVEFLDSVDFIKKANLFTKNVSSMLVNSDNTEILIWTEEHIDIVNQCFQESNQKEKDYLAEILNKKGEKNKEIKTKIFEIADHLDIDLSWNLGEE